MYTNNPIKVLNLVNNFGNFIRVQFHNIELMMASTAKNIGSNTIRGILIL